MVGQRIDFDLQAGGSHGVKLEPGIEKNKQQAIIVTWSLYYTAFSSGPRFGVVLDYVTVSAIPTILRLAKRSQDA